MAGRHARFDPNLEASPPQREELLSASFKSVVPDDPVEEEFPQMRHPPKRRAPKPAKLSREDSISLQFAPYAEVIRRISFMYTRHPVLEPPSSADQADKSDEDHVSPFFPMKPIDALLAFARDFEIAPLLLINSEVREAVVEAHKKRLEYLNVAVTTDRLLQDFIVVCSDMVAEKRPFRNVIGAYSPALRVQALLGFLGLDQPGRWEGVVAQRFESINALFVRQSQAELEMVKREQQKRQTEEFARKGLGTMWDQVHQVFLYFCQRPPPLTTEETARVRTAADEREAALKAPEQPLPQPQPRRDSVVVGKSSARFGALKKFQRAVQTLRDKLKVLQHINVATEEELAKAAARRRSSVAPAAPEAPVADFLTPREAFMAAARPSVRSSGVLFGGGGVDPLTGALPGAVVASLLDEAWDGAALLGSTGGLGAARAAEDSEEASLPITLPLPELLRWKYTNIDAPSEAPTPSATSPPASPGLKGSGRVGGPAGRGSPGSGGRGLAGSRAAVQAGGGSTPRRDVLTPRAAHSPGSAAAGRSGRIPVRPQSSRPATASPRVAGAGGLNASFRSRQSARLQTGGVVTKGKGPATLPARITLNERQKEHMRRPKPGPHSLANHDQPPKGQALLGQRKLDPGEADWNFTNQLFVERGGQWSDVPQCGITLLTKEDIALRKRIVEAWGTGATRHDVIFDDAAYLIQQAAKRYITRQRVKGGVFLKGAKKAWLEYNPPPPLWSKEAKTNVGELLTLSRVFSIIPTVASESQVVEITLDELNREGSAGEGSRRLKPSGEGVRLPQGGFLVDWEVFKRICTRLATMYVADRHASNPGLHPSTPGTLVALFDLFSLMLEPRASVPYDPSQPRLWIRASIREYGQRESVRRLAEGQKHSSGGGGGGDMGDEDDGSESLNMSGGSIAKKKPVGEGKQKKLKAHGLTSEAGAAYANSCANHGVEAILAIASQLDRPSMDASHYELKGRQLQAFVDSVSRSTCITRLDVSNARLEGGDMGTLCKALAKNTSITHLNLSENQIGTSGAEAVTELIGATDTLRQVSLMGTGLTDAMAKHMLTEGFERNSSIDQWDLSYNLLTDSVLFYLEPLLLDRTSFQRLDLSWNLLSPAAIQSLTATNLERAKPKFRKKTGVFAKPLVKVNLIATKQAQRHILANWMNKNGEKRMAMAPPYELTPSDFISIEVALRVKSLTDEQRCLLIRMFTSGRLIQPGMASRLLKNFFDGSDSRFQALELLKKRIDPSHPELVEELMLETKAMFE